MLLYNTTYHVVSSEEEHFLIWINEAVLPEIIAEGHLKNPRLLRVLSHKEPDSACFSLQWEVESSSVLHQWHLSMGMKLNEQIVAIFKDKVIGIPTLMEILR